MSSDCMSRRCANLSVTKFITPLTIFGGCNVNEHISLKLEMKEREREKTNLNLFAISTSPRGWKQRLFPKFKLR